MVVGDHRDPETEPYSASCARVYGVRFYLLWTTGRNEFSHEDLYGTPRPRVPRWYLGMGTRSGCVWRPTTTPHETGLKKRERPNFYEIRDLCLDEGKRTHGYYPVPSPHPRHSVGRPDLSDKINLLYVICKEGFEVTQCDVQRITGPWITDFRTWRISCNFEGTTCVGLSKEEREPSFLKTCWRVLWSQKHNYRPSRNIYSLKTPLEGWSEGPGCSRSLQPESYSYLDRRWQKRCEK